ncbi:MAG: T9SS type A sorting domain-containing protein [Bacteroidales bacterium]|nr:T9SS type A sorting domain-containing protein [Bacteroidales bacterium]
MQIKIHFLITIIVVLFVSTTSAQISSKGIPATMKQNILNNVFTTIEIPAPDVKTLLEEDAFTDKYGIAMRFAVSTKVNINLTEQGTWLKLEDGSSICRLAINSADALALIMYYDEFKIPEGGELFLYNETNLQVIGAFTRMNNKKGGAFATEMIYGTTTIFEYFQPSPTSSKPSIIIGEVGYVYRAAQPAYQAKGFGNADTCEVNVKCPEGSGWHEQAGSVARIIVKQGASSVWCTGSLLNNTRWDHTPYFFTADHCGPNASANDYDSWIFYFNYQSTDCEDPNSDTSFNSYTMVGATKIAAAGGAGVLSDFKLLLLNESVPLSYEPYYNGWSAINEPSPNGVTIHHPQGDIKKISTYLNPLVSSNWGSTPNTHWKVVWSETETNWGVTEGGSSGSPIFNDEGLVVGHLTGGDASCSYLLGPDYYGKFSYSWDQIGSSAASQLKPWLDPDNTGIIKLGGLVSIVEKIPSTEQISIYPNPGKGITFLEIKGEMKDEILQVSVLDLTGRKVLEKQYFQNQSDILEIDFSHLENGVYLVFVHFKNKNSQTIKFIKQD